MRDGSEAKGFTRQDALRMLNPHAERPPVNWWIIGGGLAFTLVSLGVGIGDVAGGQEIVFGASMAIVLFLMWRITRELEPDARHVLVGTALWSSSFAPSRARGGLDLVDDRCARLRPAVPGQLSLIGSVLTLAGLFIFRRFMAERSIAYIVGSLTIAHDHHRAPVVGMYYGLHHWTAAHTGGVVDARMIALIDTALESPLGQIAMVPMLAWIANSAPDRLKATFFAAGVRATNDWFYTVDSFLVCCATIGLRYLTARGAPEYHPPPPAVLRTSIFCPGWLFRHCRNDLFPTQSPKRLRTAPSGESPSLLHESLPGGAASLARRAGSGTRTQHISPHFLMYV
jgi:hypothetical protein